MEIKNINKDIVNWVEDIAEENMPIILDEAFAYYDEERLEKEKEIQEKIKRGDTLGEVYGTKNRKPAITILLQNLDNHCLNSYFITSSFSFSFHLITGL